MKSDTLITILLSILAIVFGIINARSKKRRTESHIPRHIDEELYTLPEERPQFRFSVPETPAENIMEEAIRTTSGNEDVGLPVRPAEQTVKTSRQGERKFGFNAKKAVIFSEILKPKFDEFG
ncbi:MAG: hypothetical protein GXY31_00930 [Bacteroidales bacterium]|mgnify:FL=1|nr:hypothetical protein [Bacteroidales bacterium]